MTNSPTSNEREERLKPVCGNCEKRAKTYYDKEMHAVDGEGYVTDCGTGGCGFAVGKTWRESRRRFIEKQRHYGY